MKIHFICKIQKLKLFILLLKKIVKECQNYKYFNNIYKKMAENIMLADILKMSSNCTFGCLHFIVLDKFLNMKMPVIKKKSFGT